MLPKTLYQALPYLYIVSGVFFGVVVESGFVLISSALLMVAGSLVLWMRHHSPASSSTESEPEVQNLKARSWDDIFQAEQERRLLGIARAFPLVDNNGNMIAFDRRLVERKISDAA